MRRFIIRHNQRRVCVGQKVGHFVVAVGERGGLETFDSLMKSIRGWRSPTTPSQSQRAQTSFSSFVRTESLHSCSLFIFLPQSVLNQLHFTKLKETLRTKTPVWKQQTSHARKINHRLSLNPQRPEPQSWNAAHKHSQSPQLTLCCSYAKIYKDLPWTSCMFYNYLCSSLDSFIKLNQWHHQLKSTFLQRARWELCDLMITCLSFITQQLTETLSSTHSQIWVFLTLFKPPSDLYKLIIQQQWQVDFYVVVLGLNEIVSGGVITAYVKKKVVLSLLWLQRKLDLINSPPVWSHSVATLHCG